MESLYRKYRPLTFESVVGQEHIVSTLKNAVTEGRLSHAYLFCGPRGTGKTTMARILAKALLCGRAADAPAGAGCMPDGTCAECDAIAEGTHPDVYELDAASRTGVDNVREEIVNSVGFAPVRGKYKVYIIDEVHMLTTAAFNALLKTLEEPPSHVVFILCTTDPQKILETILSRCQRFDFHRIGTEDLIGRMRYICEQEGFDYDDEALEIVAKHARGGMRDALSTLEQLSVFGDGSVHVADARSLLGETAESVLSDFCRGIAGRDVVGLFGLVRDQVGEGTDLMELTRDLVGHMRDVYTVRAAGAKEGLVDGTPEELAALAEEAGLFEGADRLARALTVLDDAALQMRDASDARLVLEIALTRLARPESDLTLEALAERLDRLEAQIARGIPAGPLSSDELDERLGSSGAGSNRAEAAGPRASTPGRGGAAQSAPGRAAVSRGATPPATTPAAMPQAAPAAPSAPTRAQAPTASSPVPARPMAAEVASAPSAPQRPVAGTAPASAPTPQRPATSPVQAPEPGAAPRRPADGPASPAQTAPARSASSSNAPADPQRTVSEPQVAPTPGAPSGAPVSDAGELQRRWSDVVKRVTAAQASRGALLQSSRAESDDGSRLVVGLPAGSGFAIKMLARADSTAVIAPIVAEVFGPRSVEYVMGGGSTPAPKAPAVSPAAGGQAPAAAADGPAPAGSASNAAPAPPVSQPASQSQAPAEAPQAPAPAEAPRAQTPSAASRGDTVAPVSLTQQPPVAPQPQQPAATPQQPTAAAQSAASMTSPQPTPARQPAPATPASPDEMPPWSSAPSAVPAADAASGPTVVPEPDIEADRRAWEEDQVPYDDAKAASYEAEAAPAPAPAPHERADAPAPASPAGRAMPWATHPAEVADDHPQTEEDAKNMLGDIFGAGIVFKSE